MLNRMDLRSQLKVLGDCRELLQQGASVLFFPEGTRSKDGRMADFKKVRLHRNNAYAGSLPHSWSQLMNLWKEPKCQR